MVVKVSIANISPAEYATAAQRAGIAGFVHSALGFGDWGVEPSIVAEHAGADLSKLRTFVLDMLALHGEQAAYVHDTVNGPGLLWARESDWPNGRFEGLK